ncbi:NAD(P)/FAD-dependent oxidoreductase [Rapidithrix thailandica]|uniref:NADH:ubiquinone reductase (non-electrogenic) n=1 Tax=Rapidithrix thailandica TaxID=413964 RepID=A0AAW9S7S9_9BACT
MKTIDVPELNIPRVVIVGGGFAGIELIKGLRNKDVQVVLLDRNNYHTFQPLLYQVATAGLEPDSIAYPLRKIFKEYQNFHFRLAEVERVEEDNQLIHTNIGAIKYDYLVLATGSRTNFFGLENVQENAMPLKTVVQALNLRSLLLQNFEKALLTPDVKIRESLMNFVIVGGGPTGVELAGALGELKRQVLPSDYPELDMRRMQIHLMEAGPRLLPGLAQASSDKSLKFLKDLGVNVWLDTQVKDYNGFEVKTNHNRAIFTQNMIWSAGVMGNVVDGLKKEVINRGNRLEVNEYNQIKGYKNVFAVGDIASMTSEKNPKGHPMVAQVAIQQGRLLAKNLMHILHNKKLKPFSYRDKGSMATIGRNKAVVEISKWRSQGALAWFVWMFVHILFLVGFRNKTITMINWLWNYFNYDRGIRLIIRPFNRSKKKKEHEEEEKLVML